MRTPRPMPKPRTRDEIDAYYADLWRRSDFALGPPEQRRWRRMLSDLRRHATRPQPWTLLDYGCGSGRFIPLLAGLGNVHAFDVTPTVLAAVRERHPSVLVIEGDGTYPTPLEGTTYDVAMSSEVIEHTLDQASFLSDLYRVLEPGGLLLLTTPNARFEVRYKEGTQGLQPIENWVTGPQLRQLMRTTGFEVLRHGTLGAHWANMPYQRWAPYRLKKRVLRRLGWWRPFDDFESWLASRLGRGITLSLVARKAP